jgi:hypothetical protein
LSTSGSVEERYLGFEYRRVYGVILMDWDGIGMGLGRGMFGTRS